MTNRTLSISMPDNLADFVENEVKKGDFASASDFMRILIRDYQTRDSERWIERLIEQQRDSAQNPATLSSRILSSGKYFDATSARRPISLHYEGFLAQAHP